MRHQNRMRIRCCSRKVGVSTSSIGSSPHHHQVQISACPVSAKKVSLPICTRGEKPDSGKIYKRHTTDGTDRMPLPLLERRISTFEEILQSRTTSRKY